MKCQGKTRGGAPCENPGHGAGGCRFHPGPERVTPERVAPPTPARIQPCELVPVPISVDELFAAMGRANSSL
jgi:hypothetical protein